MADSSDEDILDALVVCSSLQLGLTASVLNVCDVLLKQPPKRKHRVWISKYLAGRSQYGAYNSLMPELLELDSSKFRNYVRMDPETFEELFMKVKSADQRARV
jgi:hypothetical protein